MKRILTLAALLFLLISVQAQEKTKILGTWKIKNFQYGDHPNNNEWHTNFKKYKSYTPTHFVVIEINARNNVTTTSIFGTYEIKDGIYTERILNVNKESVGMIGQTFSFTLNFEGEDKMYSTGSFNGMKTSELWERVSKDDLTEELPGERKPMSGNINSGNSPLYVIKDGEKYVMLKVEDGNVSPLSIISQNQIAAIEVIKDKAATDRFQERAKYGVIIITLKEEELQETLKLLKSKGIATEI